MSINLEDVKEKYKKKNKILFSRESVCLQNLLELLRLQKHKTIVFWSFLCIDEIAKELLVKYPNEKRVLTAIELCKFWSRGEVKMPIAKKALLAVHSIAKEIDNAHDIALFHAIGQGCASVHVETHAIGIVFYELTAIVLQYGINNCENAIISKINFYIESLKRCENTIDSINLKWADFLLKDNVSNKEMVLFSQIKTDTF